MIEKNIYFTRNSQIILMRTSVITVPPVSEDSYDADTFTDVLEEELIRTSVKLYKQKIRSESDYTLLKSTNSPSSLALRRICDEYHRHECEYILYKNENVEYLLLAIHPSYSFKFHKIEGKIIRALRKY